MQGSDRPTGAPPTSGTRTINNERLRSGPARSHGRRGAARRDLPVSSRAAAEPGAPRRRRSLGLSLPVARVAPLLSGRGLPLENFLFQYWKVLRRCAHHRRAPDGPQAPLARPLTITALVALPLSLGRLLDRPGPAFYAIHAGLLSIAWAIVAVLIFVSRSSGLGKQFAAVLRVATAAFQAAYAIFYGLAGAGNGHGEDPFLVYAGFYDLFLEMLFGIGLIIWAMEETEARLSVIHARALDDTRRRKRLALIDPLTEVYNRHFFDEIRPTVEREAPRLVVLVDVDEAEDHHDRGARSG